MIDRKLNADGEAKLHLEESLASGRITRSEADVIESFFAVPPSPEWPDSGFQRRMQWFLDNMPGFASRVDSSQVSPNGVRRETSRRCRFAFA